MRISRRVERLYVMGWLLGFVKRPMDIKATMATVNIEGFSGCLDPRFKYLASCVCEVGIFYV